jgi:hypothetical protein
MAIKVTASEAVTKLETDVSHHLTGCADVTRSVSGTTF